jgi:hypothetical protein
MDQDSGESVNSEMRMRDIGDNFLKHSLLKPDIIVLSTNGNIFFYKRGGN